MSTCREAWGKQQASTLIFYYPKKKKKKQRKVSLNMWGGKKFFWQQIEGPSAIDGEIQLCYMSGC